MRVDRLRVAGEPFGQEPWPGVLGLPGEEMIGNPADALGDLFEIGRVDATGGDGNPALAESLADLLHPRELECVAGDGHQIALDVDIDGRDVFVAEDVFDWQVFGRQGDQREQRRIRHERLVRADDVERALHCPEVLRGLRIDQIDLFLRHGGPASWARRIPHRRSILQRRRNVVSGHSNLGVWRLCSAAMKHRHVKGGLVASGLVVVLIAGCGTSAELRKIQQASRGGRAALVAKHATPSITQLDAACREANCGCVTSAARALLDADIGKEALAVLQAAPKLCGQPPAGMRAEALVRSKDASGGAAAQAVIAADPQDSFAHQALALLAYREGKQPEAMKEVTLARGAGRGGAAILLQGLVSFTDGDLGAAHSTFSELVKLWPSDLVARYNLALVAQKLGRFHDSREGYLSVIADDPKYLDARFNLGVLTWQAGAIDEARHHLEKLREVAPKECDLVQPRLEAMLKTAPPTSAQIDPAQPGGGSLPNRSSSRIRWATHSRRGGEDRRFRHPAGSAIGAPPKR